MQNDICISAVSSESSVYAVWSRFRFLVTNKAPSEDSDSRTEQSTRWPRMSFVRFAVSMFLIYKPIQHWNVRNKER